MDGLAGYWDHETDWEKNLQAVRAGQIAQWRKFPNADTTGAKPDNDYFFNVAREHFPGTVASNLWESTSKKADALLLLCRWSFCGGGRQTARGNGRFTFQKGT